ncbi:MULTISPECIES: Crp/Fnr family transcriptional regulator [Amycolatopsis]|uniref:Crp/Fnr family transcriptional regulator n=2 Tax=Amycolatopsis TaxID=1813 RepID=A0A2A9FI74_9PSEU|nr:MULTISPECIES: Crp/Fnr family transcriptional regulator [Amycolatopsis]PFG50272.1 Crp/Fnr family transcriptional regulator [Amycolatopsis sulphurea]RJQ92365.1 Crp/Fnr family transcriptional regulator [Amycolatopsis panacis]
MEFEAGGGRKPSFLGRLPERDRAALLALGRPQRLGVREPVLAVGKPGTDVVVLESGHVKVASADLQARQVILDVGGPGDIYGEAAVLSGRPRMADVVALDELSVRRIDAGSFRRFLHERPSVTLELLVLQSCRLFDAQQERTYTRVPDAVTRIARRLAYLVDVCATETRHGWRLDAPLSQEELAAFIPLGRTTLATVLDRLREQGIISTGRRALAVLDLKRLLILADM